MKLCKCGAIVDRYCSRCNKQRTSTTERGYDYAWRKLSESYRDSHPLCEVCELNGRVEPACHVHHIESIENSPHRRLDTDNLIAVCEPCHIEIEGKPDPRKEVRCA